MVNIVSFYWRGLIITLINWNKISLCRPFNRDFSTIYHNEILSGL
nr:MAG TPA: hypothetical protein [Bacteriophage sp.]